MQKIDVQKQKGKWYYYSLLLILSILIIIYSDIGGISWPKPKTSSKPRKRRNHWAIVKDDPAELDEVDKKKKFSNIVNNRNSGCGGSEFDNAEIDDESIQSFQENS